MKKKKVEHLIRGWFPKDASVSVTNTSKMSINVSTKKIGVAIFFLNLVSALIVLIWLYLVDSLVYVPIVSFEFFAVYLVSIIISSEKYTAYFRKHSSIYKGIVAALLVFLIVALLARPTFYFATILFGLVGFDLTLGLILIIVNDQSKLNKATQKTNN